MKPIIKDIREISDSKEMYEMNPHPFLGGFIYIVLLGMIALGIWMYYGEIDIVSKGRGMVRPNENMSIIRSKAQGEITTWNLQEGKKVKKGDILFTVACDDLEVKRLQVAELVKEMGYTLSQLKKLRNSIEQDQNLFLPEKEKEYYDRYLKYIQDYETLKNEMTINSKSEGINTVQTQVSKEMYQDKIKEYDRLVNNLNEYKNSIKAEKNLFKDKNLPEALAFNTYLFKSYELKKNVDDKKTTYELNVALDEKGLIAKQELEDSKIALEIANNELIKLESSTVKEIEDKLKEVTLLKREADKEMQKLIIDKGLIETNQNQRQLSMEKYKIDTLVSLYNQIDELELSYHSKQRELESIELAIKDCKIKAPIDGTINILQNRSKGDLVSTETDIATIIPKNDNLYKIEVFIPNREIAKIKEGDTIKYKFDALPYKEYGLLEGKVTSISTDAKVNNNQGLSGYTLEGTLENKTFYSYKGEPAEIKVGMALEAHIITEQKKILYYLLEKINLKD